MDGLGLRIPDPQVFRGLNPDPLFLDGRNRISAYRIRNHALILPDNISIILKFILKEKSSGLFLLGWIRGFLRVDSGLS